MAALLQAAPTIDTQLGWQPGDRLSLARTDNRQRLCFPPGLSAQDCPLAGLESPDGAPMDFRIDWEAGELLIPDLPRFLEADLGVVQLEFAAGGRFRLVVETTSPRKPALRDAEVTTENGLRIALLGSDDARVLFGGGGARSRAGVADYQLARRATRLSTHGGFDQLICLPLVREMELLEHQIRTARTVLRRFRGRAMLCDEVGLGKTIEAGLVLSELHLRGLARSVLVLVPPSLIEQWQAELRRKFSLDFITHDDEAFRSAGADGWSRFDRVIISTHTAKREPHRSRILQRRWDMVIVDEAHHLRNRTTQLWRFASELDKQYMLLLTATPVQNNLDELFNLVTLLEPGLLRTARQFQKHFVDRHDKLTPRNVDELHALLAEVMVRNRRSTVGLQFTRRWATTLSVPPSPDEAELYRAVTELVKQQLRSAGKPQTPAGSTPEPQAPPGRASEPKEFLFDLDARASHSEARTTEPQARTSEPQAPSEPEAQARESEAAAAQSRRSPISRMALLSLQMALGSSAQAAAGTLATLAANSRLDAATRAQLARFAETARRLPPGAKVDRLLRLLGELPDKLVIFTQFRATQAMLAERLAAAGHAVSVFHGGLSRMEKEAAIRAFRGPARLLLCTEAGSEGRNLQFAHAVCNFDLPWNPMKIEQRIGRLSRIGQHHDVLVYNLVAAGTVEAAVLHLLDAKLSMFELVIGEIDMILGNLDEEQEFQDVVADLWAQAAGPDDFARRMEDLGNRLLAAKQAYLRQHAADERLFGARFSPDA